jgi:hypothetical protein
MKILYLTKFLVRKNEKNAIFRKKNNEKETGFSKKKFFLNKTEKNSQKEN